MKSENVETESSIDAGNACNGSSLTKEEDARQSPSIALVTPLKDENDSPTPPSSAKIVQHVNAQERALGRKAELEELRSKQLARSLRREISEADRGNDSLPPSTAELSEFFLRQRAMDKQWRQQQRDSMEYLHQYRNSTTVASGANAKHSQHSISASSSSFMDPFYQRQRQLEQEWKQQQKDSMAYLHNYRGGGAGDMTMKGIDGGTHLIPSGMNGTDHSFTIDFPALQKALEQRFVQAVQCPLPESPPSSPTAIATGDKYVDESTSGVTLIPITALQPREDSVEKPLACVKPDNASSNLIPRSSEEAESDVVPASNHLISDSLSPVPVNTDGEQEDPEDADAGSGDAPTVVSESTPEDGNYPSLLDANVANENVDDSLLIEVTEAKECHQRLDKPCLDDQDSKDENVKDKTSVDDIRKGNVDTELALEDAGSMPDSPEEGIEQSVDSSSNEADAAIEDGIVTKNGLDEPVEQECPGDDSQLDVGEKMAVQHGQTQLEQVHDTPLDNGNEEGAGGVADKYDSGTDEEVEGSQLTPEEQIIADTANVVQSVESQEQNAPVDECVSGEEDDPAISNDVEQTPYDEANYDASEESNEPATDSQETESAPEKQDESVEVTPELVEESEEHDEVSVTSVPKEQKESETIAEEELVDTANGPVVEDRETRDDLAIESIDESRAPVDCPATDVDQGDSNMSAAAVIDPVLDTSADEKDAADPVEPPNEEENASEEQEISCEVPDITRLRKPSTAESSINTEMVADLFPEISADNATDILDDLLLLDSLDPPEDGNSEPVPITPSDDLPTEKTTITDTVEVEPEPTTVKSKPGDERRPTSIPRMKRTVAPKSPARGATVASKKREASTPKRDECSSKHGSKLPRYPVSGTPKRAAASTPKLAPAADDPNLPHYMLPTLSSPHRKTSAPCTSPLRSRTPLYAQDSMEVEQDQCTNKWNPNQHSSKDGCERCLHFALEWEKRRFMEEGHHYRISVVRGGCGRSCARFPRTDDEAPVRLCRRCFYDTHKLGKR